MGKAIFGKGERALGKGHFFGGRGSGFANTNPLIS